MSDVDAYKPVFQERYDTALVSGLMERFGYTNRLQVPRLQKVVLNMGVGEGARDRKKIDAAAQELALIAGQKPIVTKARKAEANFNLRIGMFVGVKVTLRRARMYEFLERLVNVALPHTRDFRGLSPRSFDGHGNYSLGLREHMVFPEIDYDKTEGIKGMDITICTTAATDAEARALLEGFNFPFRG